MNLSTSGSPPRMRGKDALVLHGDALLGITPAYAGKSRAPSRASAPRKDHPRICGEKSQRNGCPTRSAGSPPHMRGKDYRVFRCCHKVGITPAYAGKSRLLSELCCRLWDHPRICGEKTLHGLLAHKTVGSPPHMRGKVLIVFDDLSCVGITPAYAGKSLSLGT